MLNNIIMKKYFLFLALLLYFTRNIYGFDIEKLPILPIGIKYMNPTGASITFASPYLTKELNSKNNLMLMFEPGINCGKFHIGLINYIGIDTPVLINLLKFSILHTWKDTTRIKKNQNYIGAEYAIAILGPTFTFGVYKNISSNKNTSDLLISTGVGLFF